MKVRGYNQLKFLSIEKLETLRTNNCIGENGIQYHLSELNDILNEKYTKRDMKQLKEDIAIISDDYENTREYKRYINNELHEQIDTLWLRRLLLLLQD